ncbi:MAG: TonB family protein [Gemmatimonadaceae bacterium]
MIRRSGSQGGAIIGSLNAIASRTGVLKSAAIIALAALPLAALHAQEGGGTVSGLVVDSMGSPVAAAQVAIEGTDHRTVTDRFGGFRLPGVDPGRATLTVRRIGFKPASVPITVRSSGAAQLMVTLSTVPEVLAPVEVEARREVYDARLAGYLDRAEKRAAGHIITRERIERAHSKRLVDLLRQVPSVRITTTRAWGTVAYLRGAQCTPLVYVDGFPASAGPFDLNLIDLSSVEGIEVYAGFGSVPAEFSTGRSDRCGVIAIWSRPSRPREEPVPAPSDEGVVERLMGAGLAFGADAVDIAATPIQGTLETTYPDSLLREGVGGAVTARFVVDTSGLVEMNTIELTAATHRLFAHAVLFALRDARFSPASREGQRVRQVVTLPFRFSPPPEQ